MERERWPDEIRAAVDGVICPKCGTAKADGVMVIVRYQAPVWNIVSNCFHCGFMHLWQHIDAAGVLKPKSAQVVVSSDAIPLPDWVKKL